MAILAQILSGPGFGIAFSHYKDEVLVREELNEPQPANQPAGFDLRLAAPLLGNGLVVNGYWFVPSRGNPVFELRTSL